VIAPLRPDDPRAIGPYRLRGQLGCGGMGRVFLGLSADGIPVAVKIIRAELAADREFRDRFRHEVAAAQKVSGPFTALVIDADPDGPMPWLATDYVPGPSLAEAVGSHGPLPVSKVLWLAAGLAEGLTAIHAAGVVHRDLKPSNVLLAEDRPRVIDFGISQAAWANARSAADFCSPRFMSPEHALGEAIGPPSDIFSLGAVLTFAAAGQGPFGSGPNAAMIYRLVNSPARLGRVPEQLRGLVASCLAKHPDDRPTAGRVLTQVEAIQRQSGQIGEPASKALTQGDPAAGSAGSENETDAPALTGVSSRALPYATEPQPGTADRNPRRRVSRSLPLFVPGVLAASAAAIVFMTGAVSLSPGTPAQPQAGTATTASAGPAQPQGAGTAAISGLAPSATPTQHGSPSAHKDQISPPISAFLSPSGFAAALTVPSPSGAVAVGESPSPSASRSKSGSGSPSPSGSKSGSGSPSPPPSSSSPPPSSSSPPPSSSSPPPSSSSPPPSSSTPTAPTTPTPTAPVSPSGTST
jgi:serine/threonine protein kinase